MAEAAVGIFCHSCRQRSVNSPSNLTCPNCDSGFVELLEENSARPNEDMSSSVDVESTSPNGPSALDMLSGSLMNYWPDVGPPDDDDSLSYFSIRIQPQTSTESSTANSQTETSSGSSTSRSNAQRPRYNLRIGRTRRRANPINNSGASSSNQNNDSQQPPRMTPNLFLEGFLQQLLNGADPAAVLGGSQQPWGMFPLHGNPGDYAWGANGIDDVITQLLGQLDNSGAPPASADAIQKLPKLTITKEHVEKKKECSVCMDTFIIDDEAKQLPCDHLFHTKCIDPWLELHNTCPICRTNIENRQDSSCPRGTQAAATSGPSTSGGV